jgi:hypothetical protein
MICWAGSSPAFASANSRVSSIQEAPRDYPLGLFFAC